MLNRKFIQNEKLVRVLYLPINSFISNLIFVSISLFLFQAFLLSSIAGMSNGPLLCRTYLPMPNWQLWLQLSLLVLSNLVLAHQMISRILNFLFAIAFSWKKWLFHKENNSSRSVNLRMTFWWLLSCSRHWTTNFPNSEYFVCLLFYWFFSETHFFEACLERVIDGAADCWSYFWSSKK